MIPHIVGRGLGPAFLYVDFTGVPTFLVRVAQDSWSWFVDHAGPSTRNGGSEEKSSPSDTRRHVVGGVEGACRASRPHFGGDRWGPLARTEVYALHLRF